MSSVHLQLMVPSVISEVRITIVVYRSQTFFQHGLDKNLNMIAPIVGIKIQGEFT